jgi:hypothetical protein
MAFPTDSHPPRPLLRNSSTLTRSALPPIPSSGSSLPPPLSSSASSSFFTSTELPPPISSLPSLTNASTGDPLSPQVPPRPLSQSTNASFHKPRIPARPMSNYSASPLRMSSEFEAKSDSTTPVRKFSPSPQRTRGPDTLSANPTPTRKLSPSPQRPTAVPVTRLIPSNSMNLESIKMKEIQNESDDEDEVPKPNFRDLLKKMEGSLQKTQTTPVRGSVIYQPRSPNPMMGRPPGHAPPPLVCTLIFV